MIKKAVLFILLIFTCPTVLKAQEEVILSSEKIEEAEKSTALLKVRPRYRYVDSTNQKTLITIAYRPQRRQFPGSFEPIYQYQPSPFGNTLVLSYERLLRNHQFSFFIENTTRLYAAGNSGYDYDNKFRVVDNFGNHLNRGGEFDANLTTFDIGAKWYYRQKRKIEYGASGINPFGEYLFLRVKNVVSFVHRTTLVLSSPFGLTDLHVEEKKWLINPGYLMAGWGTQRTIYKRFLIDFYVGFGLKVVGQRTHVYRDVLVDIGLSLGLGLGKRN